MAEQNVNLKQYVSPQLAQRTLLLGRVKMAQAIQMPESEWAKVLSEIEKDPLFYELMGARNGGQRIVKFKRFGRTGLSGQFYEMQDANVVGGGGDQTPEALLDRKKYLLDLIQKVGQENFEKYFLFREEGETQENISQICGISNDEVKQVQDFILDMSVQSEFYHPSHLDSQNIAKPTLVGKIVGNNDGTFSISYFSPHLARGMYEINRSALKRWQKDKHLDRGDAARLRRFVGLLELSNLKQGAFWRVMDFLLKSQENYFRTKDVKKMAPHSLREVARQLQFAPSTISRVMSTKSVLLPWDHEVPISFLMPGQRKVILNVLDHILGDAKEKYTDIELAKKINDEYGIRVSRRTITACRHALKTGDQTIQ
jgi:DNA-directed RNA polymerase specialized sigma54-like protein